MPPTPTSVRSGPTRPRRRRTTSSDRCGERASAEATGADRLDGGRRAGEVGPADRGVGRDDAVEAGRQGEVGDGEHVVVAEVGGDLHQQRHPALGAGLVGATAYGGQQGLELLDGLQVAQAGGVGRGDVDDEVVGVGGEQPGRLLVVADRVLLGHDLGLADVDAEAPRIEPPLRRASAASRRATTSAPSLLNPIRLTIARSALSRKSRGCGLPGWASPVTVPISTWPKPRAASPSMPTAFLSKPAARPSGCGKVSPRAWIGADGRADESARDRLRDPDRPERGVVDPLRVDPGQRLVEEEVVGLHASRASAVSVAQSCSDRTPMSPRRIASSPCTAAPRPWIVVMHGMSVETAAVRMS